MANKKKTGVMILQEIIEQDPFKICSFINIQSIRQTKSGGLVTFRVDSQTAREILNKDGLAFMYVVDKKEYNKRKEVAHV